jgi:two-component sensor histidine kinase
MLTLTSADQTILKIANKAAKGRRLNVWLAYLLVTAIIVGIELARIYFLGGVPKDLPKFLFLPFFPVLLLSALCLQRYTGVYASVLSPIVAAATTGPVPHSLTLKIDLVPTLGFMAVGIIISLVFQSFSRLYQRHQFVSEQSEVLIRDLNHRVKNHLQAIAAMVHMSVSKVDEPSKDVLRAVASRLSVVARIYDRLHLDSENAAVRVPVSEFLGALCDDLLTGVIGERDITINRDLANEEITTAKAVPMGLLVNELVTNSLKHAFPEDEGSINVSFHRSDSDYVLEVCDSGIGGDWNKRGTGLKLIGLLAKQLDGQVEQTTKEGRCYTITFPA